jgi:hypothetical protein
MLPARGSAHDPASVREVAPAAHEQRRAQFFFEGGHGAADGWLPHAQPQAGRGETVLVDDGKNDFRCSIVGIGTPDMR